MGLFYSTQCVLHCCVFLCQAGTHPHHLADNISLWSPSANRLTAGPVRSVRLWISKDPRRLIQQTAWIFAVGCHFRRLCDCSISVWSSRFFVIPAGHTPVPSMWMSTCIWSIQHHNSTNISHESIFERKSIVPLACLSWYILVRNRTQFMIQRDYVVESAISCFIREPAGLLGRPLSDLLWGIRSCWLMMSCWLNKYCYNDFSLS